MTFYHRGMFDEAKAHLMDALRAERSRGDRDGEAGADNGLPLLLSDIGMVHSKLFSLSRLPHLRIVLAV